MTIQSDQLISLGYGRFVRSDEVVAIEPIIEDRGPGRRTHVWVRGIPQALVASRSEKAIADDLLTRADDAAHLLASAPLMIFSNFSTTGKELGS